MQHWANVWDVGQMLYSSTLMSYPVQTILDGLFAASPHWVNVSGSECIYDLQMTPNRMLAQRNIDYGPLTKTMAQHWSCHGTTSHPRGIPRYHPAMQSIQQTAPPAEKTPHGQKNWNPSGSVVVLTLFEVPPPALVFAPMFSLSTGTLWDTGSGGFHLHLA